MIRLFIAALAVVTMVAVGAADAQLADTQTPKGPPQERLGARAALTGTLGDLNEHFGHGYDLNLYFTEKLFGTFYLEIQIGATYFGDLLVTELDDSLTRIDGVNSEMRLAYLTLGPQYAHDISETHTLYFSLGVGIYTVSMLFDTGVQAFDESDQHFGGNVGAGMYWRITTNWNIDVNANVQTLLTDEDDLYPFFTGGDKNPLLLVVGFGLAMNLR
jgi:opacity protein-like surface antigen